MTKFDATGVAIAIDFAGGTSHSTIGQVIDINGPGLSRNPIDATTRDSTNLWREFLKGMKDAGEVTFTIAYDPDEGTHDDSTGLLSDFGDDSTIPSVELTFPDTTPTTWTADGFLSNFNPGAPMDDLLTADVTMKMSGEPTFA